MSEEILLVEDNPLNRKLVVRVLANRGYRLAEAEDAPGAEAWLSGNAPALILMDVSLPGEDGLSFVRRLRARGGRRIPIVAVTAHAMAGDRDRALEAGCDAYLPKPVDLGLLIKTVEALCGAPKEAA